MAKKRDAVEQSSGAGSHGSVETIILLSLLLTSCSHLSEGNPIAVFQFRE